jgi:hypothetical protein
MATLTSGGSAYRADLDPPPTHSTGAVHVPVLLVREWSLAGQAAGGDSVVDMV